MSKVQKPLSKKDFILANNGTFSGMFYQKGGNWRCRKVINGEMVEMVIKTSYLHKVLGNKPMYNHISGWFGSGAFMRQFFYGFCTVRIFSYFFSGLHVYLA